MNFQSLLVLLFVVLIGWYLSFSASRLDRLHHRVETSWATLDALLQQRAALAHEIVAESNLDPATAYLISSSAARAKPLIRLFRLAGKAPLPVRYAFEDDVL